MRGTLRQPYPAVVVDNADPERRARIQVRCEALVGGGRTLDAWIEPRFPYAGPGFGFFFVPAVGSHVEIEAATETLTEEARGTGFVSNPDFTWSASLYRSTADIPAEFGLDAGASYAKRLGIKTEAGLLLLFDDALQVLSLVGPLVELGAVGLGVLDGVVHGSGVDPATGLTYTALGNTSAVVKAKK